MTSPWKSETRLADELIKQRAEIKRLRNALKDAANEVVNLGCTCLNNKLRHDKDCQGCIAASKYFSILSRSK